MVFEKLEELEFDSFRKCMSVVVRDDATGIVHVVAKGAETAILPKGEAINDVLTNEGVSQFTLIIVYKGSWILKTRSIAYFF